MLLNQNQSNWRPSIGTVILLPRMKVSVHWLKLFYFYLTLLLAGGRFAQGSTSSTSTTVITNLTKLTLGNVMALAELFLNVLNEVSLE